MNEGLPYDRCLVGVMTNLPEEEGLKAHDILSEEQVLGVARTQMDLVLSQGAGVINADDARLTELAKFCDGEVILYSQAPSNASVREHLAQGGRCVYCKDAHVILARGDQETQLFAVDFKPIAKLIKDESLELSTLLACVASAWALDIAPLLIRAGLKNFGQQTPSTDEPSAVKSA
jgi:cyanophycin synthetase